MDNADIREVEVAAARLDSLRSQHACFELSHRMLLQTLDIVSCEGYGEDCSDGLYDIMVLLDHLDCRYKSMGVRSMRDVAREDMIKALSSVIAVNGSLLTVIGRISSSKDISVLYQRMLSLSCRVSMLAFVSTDQEWRGKMDTIKETANTLPDYYETDFM